MAEFRYQATNVTGMLVTGVLTAKNRSQAKKAAEDVCRARQIHLSGLQKKYTFIYKVQQGVGEPMKREQKAFSKEEVQNALQKMGYRVISIRKRLLDLKFKPPVKDVVIFVRICADLLREKLPYDEILQLVSNDTENRTLRATIKEIYQDLRDGKEGKVVFGKHVDVLGRFPSYMLGVASTSGNMAEVYESTAKFLERNEEFKKNLRSALVMPMGILLTLIGAVIFYVAYVFPKTAEMFIRYDIELGSMTSATLAFSNFLQSNIFWLLPTGLVPSVALFFYFSSPRGRYLLDRCIIKIPVIGSLLHKTSIEIFARVFHALYSGSGENIAVIRIAAEACRNVYMERQIKDLAVPMMLKEGKGLVESLERADVFTPNAIGRFRSGAESGALRAAALQLANYYEKETTYKLKSVVDLINIAISLLIMVVMTGLTLVSSEMAFIKPKHPMMR